MIITEAQKSAGIRVAVGLPMFSTFGQPWQQIQTVRLPYLILGRTPDGNYLVENPELTLARRRR